MEKLSFSLILPAQTIFGAGRITELPNIAKPFGNNLLLIVGSYSLKTSGKLDKIKSLLFENGFDFHAESTSGEPEPEIIDTICSKYRNKNISLVISIGGGSVIDTGKAVSAMLCEKGSVKDFLEGVGHRQVSGEKIPFIAIPTTSGTGSEATKNAVISEKGNNGFKKSLRHNNYVPNIALIDPEFTINLPQKITSSTGADALAQLIESYISSGSNSFTDSLALEGIKLAGKSLPALLSTSPTDIQLRSNMSYASYVSGICLANAGLTIIHGIAGTIGGYFEAAHGTICGTILPAGVDLIFRKCTENQSLYKSTLKKLSTLYKELSGKDKGTYVKNAENFVRLLYSYREIFMLPGLIDLGVKEESFRKIASNSGIKNTPVKITEDDILNILNLSK